MLRLVYSSLETSVAPLHLQVTLLHHLGRILHLACRKVTRPTLRHEHAGLFTSAEAHCVKLDITSRYATLTRRHLALTLSLSTAHHRVVHHLLTLNLLNVLPDLTF